MKAAYIEETGPADNIILRGFANAGRRRASQVLVKTGAVAVNPVDTYIRNGANYWELPKPFIIGCDLAGTVESRWIRTWRNSKLVIESGVRIKVCWAGRGPLPSTVPLTSAGLYPTPDNVSDETAAACAFGRSYRASRVVSRCRICKPASQSSSTAARAASGRWWCKWQRRLALV